MNAPQVIILALFFIDLLIESNRHGLPKEGEHNIWTDIGAKTLFILLLWWGGFFTF